MKSSETPNARQEKSNEAAPPRKRLRIKATRRETPNTTASCAELITTS
jgi:hypothetical protein